MGFVELGSRPGSDVGGCGRNWRDARIMPNSSNPAWNDLDANGNWYNVPGQGNSGRRTRLRTRDGIPTATATGCTRRASAIRGFPAIRGAICPTSAACGTAMTALAGVGRRGWAAAIRGGTAAGIYGPNIGIGYGGYRPPLRPHPPRRPFGRVGLIAVGRRPMPMTKGSLPARDRGGVVVIAGHAVAPLHPVGARPQYDHSASGFVNHTVISNAEPRGGSGQVRSGPTAPGPTFGTARSGLRRCSTRLQADSPHFSAGGGGGSASHVSGGFSGGGGGGGASHGAAAEAEAVVVEVEVTTDFGI